MDLKEIQNLIKFVAKSGASEVKLEMDDIKITIKTGSEQQKLQFTSATPANASSCHSTSAAPAATAAPAAPSRRRFQIYNY